MSLLGTREAASCVAQGCPRRIAGRSLRACCFRAVAAVPASAPAYGRRAKPGSQAFRAVAAVPASARLTVAVQSGTGNPSRKRHCLASLPNKSPSR